MKQQPADQSKTTKHPSTYPTACPNMLSCTRAQTVNTRRSLLVTHGARSCGMVYGVHQWHLISHHCAQPKLFRRTRRARVYIAYINTYCCTIKNHDSFRNISRYTTGHLPLISVVHKKGGPDWISYFYLIMRIGSLYTNLSTITSPELLLFLIFPELSALTFLLLIFLVLYVSGVVDFDA